MITSEQLEEWKVLAERLALDTLDIETREPLDRGQASGTSVEDAEAAADAVAALVAEVERLRNLIATEAGAQKETGNG